MRQIADWLDRLGMSEYAQSFADAQSFAENRFDVSILRDLTDQDLNDLGVVLGDRRRMLPAIAELAGENTPVAAQHPPVTEPRAQDAAERRQVTVLFSDLVGSTALSARMDPEDLRGIIGAYHHCCTEVVERNGGFVAKFMGDGVLGCFGSRRLSRWRLRPAWRHGSSLVHDVDRQNPPGVKILGSARVQSGGCWTKSEKNRGVNKMLRRTMLKGMAAGAAVGVLAHHARAQEVLKMGAGRRVMASPSTAMRSGNFEVQRRKSSALCPPSTSFTSGEIARCSSGSSPNARQSQACADPPPQSPVPAFETLHHSQIAVAARIVFDLPR